MSIPPSPPPWPLLGPAPPIKGVRKDVALLIEKVAGGVRAKDFAFLAPTGAIDRRNKVTIAETNDGEIATLEVEVDMHLPSVSAKMPYRIRLRDETALIHYVNSNHRELLASIEPGDERLAERSEVFWRLARDVAAQHRRHLRDTSVSFPGIDS